MGSFGYFFIQYSSFTCISAQQVGAGRVRSNTKPKDHTGIDFLFVDVPKNLQAGRSRVNTSSTIHKGLDLIFADVPENLPVPNISTNIPVWNKLHDSYYDCFFAFAKSNFYDHGLFVLPHCSSASVFKHIFDWGHTYDFYIAEDWFGMNDLDLQSPVVPSGVVSSFLSTPLLY